MNTLEWLESTALAILVQESMWAYPLVLSLHAVGMSLLVGTIVVIDLRLLGVAKRAPVETFVQLIPVAWTGFIINAMTGASLFIAGATTHYFNPAFRIKIALIVVGGLTAWAFGPLVFRRTPHWPSDGSTPVSAKCLAGLSLAIWLGAITAGRLIAYIL